MSLSPFPSSQEQTVASALLLLSYPPPSSSPSLSPARFDVDDPSDSTPERIRNNSCRDDSFVSSGSNMSSSSLVSDDGSSEQIRGRRIRFFSAVARYRRMKFKVLNF